MVLFILFPGCGLSEKHWEKHWEDFNKKNKIIKTNFIQQLKTIGDVYKYTPNISNVMNYCNEEKKYKGKFYIKPSTLTLDDFNIDKQCELVYEKVKNYKGKFILIGHSIGTYYAIHFSKLYKSRCLNTILIDGSIIASKYIKEWNNILYKKIKKYGNITNEFLQSLLYNIQNSKTNKVLNENISKLVSIKFYYENNQFMKFNGKLAIPNISIRSLDIDIKKNKMIIDDYEILYKQNGKNSKIHYLIDATHFPWFIPRYCDEIIYCIKSFVNCPRKT